MEGGVTYPKRLFLVISTIFLFASLLSPSSTAATDAGDGFIMQKLALSMKPSGWSGDPCQKPWDGVKCDSGRVTIIKVESKGLSGEIPPELSKLSKLKFLSLQGNQLTGAFPSLTDLPSLQGVYLNDNSFTKVPSPFLKGLTGLQTLNIQGNPKLSPWMFPDSLADSASLTTLIADNCSLEGTIPDFFGSFPSLQSVRLSYNNLTGPLLVSLGKSGIQYLWINNQVVGLSGRIDIIGRMSQLKQAWLQVNKFTGSIPDISKDVSLSDLSLRDNLLTGPVPDSLSKVTTVALQNNRLQGPMPGFNASLGNTNSFCSAKPEPCDPRVDALLKIAGDFGHPIALAESWKGNDPCKKWIGVACDNQGGVTVLNFARQGFVGKISPAFADLTSLTSINLSNNTLTGTIPSSLTSLKNLELLDVANNNVSGKLPGFSSKVQVNTTGNPFFGRELPVDGKTPTGAGGSRKRVNNVWVIVLPILATLTFLAIVAFVVYKRCLKNRKLHQKWFKGSGKSTTKGPDDNTSSSPKVVTGYTSDKPSVSSGANSDLHGYDSGSIIIPVEVLRKVTDNFSGHNILGQGGFGVVYRGKLPDGTQIAVKRMEAGGVASSKGMTEFEAEIGVLSKVRHRHLVALHGFCVNGNERFLVYEYMPQGTLGQHLFSCKQLGIPHLTWKQRVQILLDVARGVEYLHGLAQHSFIHRDLKPSNVLLSDDLRAKVSDFGLVRNAPDGKHSLETRLAGTFGYLAPEYAATGKVTIKVDVFAFGVVAMEAITGRKALDENLPDEKIHLVSWFRRVLVLNSPEAIRESLDPVLEPDQETFESICKAAELAGHCTAREPHQRPDMGHAVNVLSPLVEQWRPAASRHDEDSFATDLHMSLPQALQKWQSSEEGDSFTMSTTFNGHDSSSMSKGGYSVNGSNNV